MATIPLVEVFRSLQGEGYHAGRDAIFVRFAGCPLSCVFADGAVCDTPYQQANLKVGINELFDDVIPAYENFQLDAILNVPLESRTMLVLTGGEPTASPAFDAVVRRALDAGFYVAVETNGTRWRDGLAVVDWVSVSPKDRTRQGSSAPHHNHNPQSSALDPTVVELMTQSREVDSGEYRYVIGTREAPEPPLIDRPAFRHYLSPAALADGEGLEWKQGFKGFAPGALERCLELAQESRGAWRVSIQQHKLLGVR